MTIVIGRVKFLLGTIGVAILVCYSSRINYFITGSLTDGEVVDIRPYYSTGFRNAAKGRYEAAIIKYSIDSVPHYFQGVSNVNLVLGESVRVIYKVSKPDEAKVYSFNGFWYPPLIYLFFSFFAAAGVSIAIFTKRGDTLLVELGKRNTLRKVSKSKNLNIAV
jgi:hypothetical protein